MGLFLNTTNRTEVYIYIYIPSPHRISGEADQRTELKECLTTQFF
jgi:hypothetical protein